MEGDVLNTLWCTQSCMRTRTEAKEMKRQATELEEFCKLLGKYDLLCCPGSHGDSQDESLLM